MSTATTDSTTSSHAGDHGTTHKPGEIHPHIVPPSVLLSVFGALLVLTVVTVGVSYMHLGAASVWVALGVAVAKAALVAMFFMHLRWDAPFNGVVLIASLFFVALFIGVAVLDSKEYKVNYDQPGRGQVMSANDVTP